jgi:hypothetical protein
LAEQEHAMLGSSAVLVAKPPLLIAGSLQSLPWGPTSLTFLMVLCHPWRPSWTANR